MAIMLRKHKTQFIPRSKIMWDLFQYRLVHMNSGLDLSKLSQVSGSPITIMGQLSPLTFKQGIKVQTNILKAVSKACLQGSQLRSQTVFLI